MRRPLASHGGSHPTQASQPFSIASRAETIFCASLRAWAGLASAEKEVPGKRHSDDPAEGLRGGLQVPVPLRVPSEVALSCLERPLRYHGEAPLDVAEPLDDFAYRWA